MDQIQHFHIIHRIKVLLLRFRRACLTRCMFFFSNCVWHLITVYSDSGANYLDGICHTARTVHFGQPTSEMREAYTRVLQSHASLSLTTISVTLYFPLVDRD